MRHKFRFCFHVICYVATFLLFICGIVKFIKNEDLCETSFKSFNEGPYSLYPSVTLCLSNQFDEDVLKKDGLNKSIYLSYLLGKQFDDEMLKINFSQATWSLRMFSHV